MEVCELEEVWALRWRSGPYNGHVGPSMEVWILERISGSQNGIWALDVEFVKVCSKCIVLKKEK